MSAAGGLAVPVGERERARERERECVGRADGV